MKYWGYRGLLHIWNRTIHISFYSENAYHIYIPLRCSWCLARRWYPNWIKCWPWRTWRGSNAHPELEKIKVIVGSNLFHWCNILSILPSPFVQNRLSIPICCISLSYFLRTVPLIHSVSLTAVSVDDVERVRTRISMSPAFPWFHGDRWPGVD
jgi:hypothetical protein